MGNKRSRGVDYTDTLRPEFTYCLGLDGPLRQELIQNQFSRRKKLCAWRKDLLAPGTAPGHGPTPAGVTLADLDAALAIEHWKCILLKKTLERCCEVAPDNQNSYLKVFCTPNACVDALFATDCCQAGVCIVLSQLPLFAGRRSSLQVGVCPSLPGLQGISTEKQMGL